MLENLLQLIKEVGQEQVVDNTDIPDNDNDNVMALAAESVTGVMQQELSNGHGEDVLKMFQTNSSAQIMSSPVAQNIQTNFVDNITSKLGINKNVAMGLAATLIPIIISKLVKKTNSTNEADSGFDLTKLIGSLTGGGNNGGIDIAGLISQFTGNKQNGSGGGIADIISQFTGGGNQNNNNQQSGGIGDLIKGFFGK